MALLVVVNFKQSQQVSFLIQEIRAITPIRYGFMNDWNYRFGQKKTVLSRLDSDDLPSPAIEFGAMENDIIVSVTCYPTSSSDGDSDVHKCKIKNVPLQRWV